MIFKHIWSKQHLAFPLLPHPCVTRRNISVLWGVLLPVTLCPQKRRGRKMPIRWTNSSFPLPWAAFSWSQLVPLGPWEMLNFNWLRWILSVLKTAQNQEVRVLLPLLMLNRFAQIHSTYSTTLGQNLGLAPGVKFVIGFIFPAGALEVE